MAVSHLTAIVTPVMANPQGGTVAAGEVSIADTGSGVASITQSTDRAIINWQSFSNQAQETVRFEQPTATSTILNRVTGAASSTIAGKMEANGRVFLMNPNGIVFSPTAQVNVGGLVATTLAIEDKDFLAGSYRFRQDPAKPNAAVINQGHIQAGPKGSVALIAPLVANEGHIQADGGRVHLAAGTRATVSLDQGQLVTLEADLTAGKDVVIDRAAIPDAVKASLTGTAFEASSVRVVDGRVTLEGASGHAVHSGTIVARSTSDSPGQVSITSTRTTVAMGGSVIDTSVVAGACRQRPSVSAGSIELNSAGRTDFQHGARLIATAEHGAGGTVEVSASKVVHADGYVDTRSSHGKTGTYLIDPADVIIVVGDGVTPLPDGFLDALVLQQSTSGIAISAANSITVDLVGPSTPLGSTLGSSTIRLTTTTGDIVSTPGSAIGASCSIFISAGRDVVLDGGMGPLACSPPAVTIEAGRDIVHFAANDDASSILSPGLPGGTVKLHAGRDITGTNATTSARRVELCAGGSITDFALIAGELKVTAQGDVNIFAGSKAPYFPKLAVESVAGENVTLLSSSPLDIGCVTATGDLEIRAADLAPLVGSASTIVSRSGGVTLQASDSIHFADISGQSTVKLSARCIAPAAGTVGRIQSSDGEVRLFSQEQVLMPSVSAGCAITVSAKCIALAAGTPPSIQSRNAGISLNATDCITVADLSAKGTIRISGKTVTASCPSSIQSSAGAVLLLAQEKVLLPCISAGCAITVQAKCIAIAGGTTRSIQSRNVGISLSATDAIAVPDLTAKGTIQISGKTVTASCPSSIESRCGRVFVTSGGTISIDTVHAAKGVLLHSSATAGAPADITAKSIASDSCGVSFATSGNLLVDRVDSPDQLFVDSRSVRLSGAGATKTAILSFADDSSARFDAPPCTLSVTRKGGTLNISTSGGAITSIDAGDTLTAHLLATHLTAVDLTGRSFYVGDVQARSLVVVSGGDLLQSPTAHVGVIAQTVVALATRGIGSDRTPLVATTGSIVASASGDVYLNIGGDARVEVRLGASGHLVKLEGSGGILTLQTILARDGRVEIDAGAGAIRMAATPTARGITADRLLLASCDEIGAADLPLRTKVGTLTVPRASGFWVKDCGTQHLTADQLVVDGPISIDAAGRLDVKELRQANAAKIDLRAVGTLGLGYLVADEGELHLASTNGCIEAVGVNGLDAKVIEMDAHGSVRGILLNRADVLKVKSNDGGVDLFLNSSTSAEIDANGQRADVLITERSATEANLDIRRLFAVGDVQLELPHGSVSSALLGSFEARNADIRVGGSISLHGATLRGSGSVEGGSLIATAGGDISVEHTGPITLRAIDAGGHVYVRNAQGDIRVGQVRGASTGVSDVLLGRGSVTLFAAGGSIVPVDGTSFVSSGTPALLPAGRHASYLGASGVVGTKDAPLHVEAFSEPLSIQTGGLDGDTSAVLWGNIIPFEVPEIVGTPPGRVIYNNKDLVTLRLLVDLAKQAAQTALEIGRMTTSSVLSQAAATQIGERAADEAIRNSIARTKIGLSALNKVNDVVFVTADVLQTRQEEGDGSQSAMQKVVEAALGVAIEPMLETALTALGTREVAAATASAMMRGIAGGLLSQLVVAEIAHFIGEKIVNAFVVSQSNATPASVHIPPRAHTSAFDR